MNIKKKLYSTASTYKLSIKTVRFYYKIVDDMLYASPDEEIIKLTIGDKLPLRCIEKLIRDSKEHAAFKNRLKEVQKFNATLTPEQKRELDLHTQRVNKSISFPKLVARRKRQAIRDKFIAEIEAETRSQMSTNKTRKPKKKKPFWHQ